MADIYGLLCPKTGELRYIGKSVRPAHRLETHIWWARAGNPQYVSRWIAALDRDGLSPQLVILHRASDFNWRAMERFLIASARAMGLRLTNIANGGQGVDLGPEDFERVRLRRKAGFTPEVCARKSVSMAAAWQREDSRKRLLDGAKANAARPEFREHLRRVASLPRSPEAKARQEEGRQRYFAERRRQKQEAETC